MITFILSVIVIFIVDSLLVSIAFYSLKYRFLWKLSPRFCFLILIVVFAFQENYIVPMVYLLDATITIRNEAVASFFDIKPDYHLITLFDIGFLDFIIWCVQAFFAGIIGERLFNNDNRKADIIG